MTFMNHEYEHKAVSTRRLRQALLSEQSAGNQAQLETGIETPVTNKRANQHCHNEYYILV